MQQILLLAINQDILTKSGVVLLRIAHKWQVRAVCEREARKYGKVQPPSFQRCICTSNHVCTFAAKFVYRWQIQDIVFVHSGTLWGAVGRHPCKKVNRGTEHSTEARGVECRYAILSSLSLVKCQDIAKNGTLTTGGDRALLGRRRHPLTTG